LKSFIAVNMAIRGRLRKLAKYMGVNRETGRHFSPVEGCACIKIPYYTNIAQIYSKTDYILIDKRENLPSIRGIVAETSGCGEGPSS